MKNKKNSFIIKYVKDIFIVLLLIVIVALTYQLNKTEKRDALLMEENINLKSKSNHIAKDIFWNITMYKDSYKNTVSVLSQLESLKQAVGYSDYPFKEVLLQMLYNVETIYQIEKMTPGTIEDKYLKEIGESLVDIAMKLGGDEIFESEKMLKKYYEGCEKDIEYSVGHINSCCNVILDSLSSDNAQK